MGTTDSLHQSAQALQQTLLDIRRHLHQHPELSFEEYNTTNFIEAQLDLLGIAHQRITDTGVVAIIEGNAGNNECIALRADIDALPIIEANEVGYKSKNDGVMHACGHDVHTTCLLGAAMLLQQHRALINGTIKLIFQPGEEKSPGGASQMIAKGVLQHPAPRAIIGLHVEPSMSVGQVGFCSGSYMASADEIHITIKGKGGHAALPHLTIDPITIAAQIITSLQQVISRRCPPLQPAVLSFGKISGGHTTNVIPDVVELQGTFRTFDEQWRKEGLQLIQQITEGIATSMGATTEINIPLGYPVLVNAPQLTKRVSERVASFIGEEQVLELPKRMSSEDFSFYTHQIPGCFFRLGTNQSGEKFTSAVHTPTFDIDESALVLGAKLMAMIAIEELKG